MTQLTNIPREELEDIHLLDMQERRDVVDELRIYLADGLEALADSVPPTETYIHDLISQVGQDQALLGQHANHLMDLVAQQQAAMRLVNEERARVAMNLAKLKTAIVDIDRTDPLIETLAESIEEAMWEGMGEFEYSQAVEALEYEGISSADAHALAFVISGVEPLFEEPNAYLPALKRLVLQLEMVADEEATNE